MLLSAVPVLPARNIQETITFFEQHLGFTARHVEDEYGILLQDAVEVHCWRCADK